MDKDFHDLGNELVRFLDEFSPAVIGERYPTIVKLVLRTLDDAMRADKGLAPRSWPWTEQDGEGAQ